MIYNSEIETLKLKKLRSLQNQRLRDLLLRLQQTVPFYQQQWEQAGVDLTQVKSVEDLHKLPFTKKSHLRDHYPYGLFAKPMAEVRRIHASSGTTGKPTVVGYSQNDLEIFDEVVARSLVCAGARPGMKLHNAYGYGLFTGGLGMHGGATKLGMAVIPVSGGMTERQLTILQDFEPEVMCCTPSYALTLGERFKELGVDTASLAVKYAVLGAEPWTETVRQEVESTLHVDATNIYGLSEIIGPGVSQEEVDEKGRGSHIWEDHFFPEVVDAQSGEPLPHGREGVLVFTTLTKEAFPLVRYWTNDICSIYYDTDSRRSHIKMSALKGRSDEMLIIRGVNLFHTQVEAVFTEFQELTPNYQLVVARERNMDQVKVLVECHQHLQPRSLSNLSKQLTARLKGNIGLSMQVEIKESGSIPRSEGGKLSRIVDTRS